MSIHGNLILTSVIIPGTGGAYATLRLYRSIDAGISWEEIQNDGFLQYPVATIVPGNPDHLFVHLIPISKTFFISSDNGITWDSLANPIQTDIIKRTYLKPNVPGLIFAIGESFFSRDRLFRSTDYGRTWSEPYLFPASSDGSHIAVGLSLKTKAIFVNSDTDIGGSFFLTSYTFFHKTMIYNELDFRIGTTLTLRDTECQSISVP